MARVLATVGLAALALLATCATATPTMPVVANTSDLDWWYLNQNIFTNEYSVARSSNGNSITMARGALNRSLSELGWDYLVITGAGQANPYAGGYLEGWLTADRMVLMGIPAEPTGATGEWVSKHIAWMRMMAAANYTAGSTKATFWSRTSWLLQYMQGMTDGLNKAQASNYTFTQVFLMSFGPELGDVQTAVKVQAGSQAGFRQNWKPSHCSALIKVTADDLYVAHDTWDDFVGMAYRMYKVYEFDGMRVAFSSHPGDISSTDDWYVTSAELAIQETTNGVMNLTLFNAVVPETASEFIRVMVATWEAWDGATWTELFAMHNSGTYNNQYMVVDFKLYAPGSPLLDNTLWVAEQLPGIVVRGDETAVLQKQGYWASYNIPYYPEIYKLSGYAQDYVLYGDFYSYTKYARPEIFARNQSDVKGLADMMRMMRFNDWQHDPLSAIHNCSGAPGGKCQTPRTSMLSIASRGDLMPVYNTTEENVAHYGPLWSFMAQGCFGAIDSKIAAWSQRTSLNGWVVSGPTNDQQPTFQWDKGACAGHPAPKGTPTTVDYPWVQFAAPAFYDMAEHKASLRRGPHHRRV